MLSDRRILIVEDEYFVAQDIANALREHGAKILGPCATPDAAAEMIRTERLDGAVVDMNLRGDTSAGVAAALEAAGVPILIVTGYSRNALPERFQATPYLEKPVEAAMVARTLAAHLARVAQAKA